MADPFVGEIRAFPFGFAPRGWAPCDGQLVSISQNMALFSLLGTTYGGNGTTTFALPDLRSRVSNHRGQGPGLGNLSMGQRGGNEAHRLTVAELPSHNHDVHASKRAADTNVPTNAAPAAGGTYDTRPIATADQVAMVPTFNAGSSAAHNNRQPFLGVQFCIALEGVFPPRNA
jgi:microcystin-dependent protein